MGAEESSSSAKLARCALAVVILVWFSHGARCTAPPLLSLVAMFVPAAQLGAKRAASLNLSPRSE